MKKHVILLTLVLAACAPTKKLEFNLPDNSHLLDDVLKSFGGPKCQKAESDQTLPQDLSNAIVLKDTIESQDIETTNCDDTVIKSHGPIRDFSQSTEIEAPKDLTGKVNYIQITNQRTCDDKATMSIDDGSLVKKVTLAGGQTIDTDMHITQVGESGKINLVLQEGLFALSETSVLDGLNALQIKYFGKCLEYKDKIKTRTNDANDCKTAELLATQDIVVNIKVDRPEVTGVRTIPKSSTCK